MRRIVIYFFLFSFYISEAQFTPTTGFLYANTNSPFPTAYNLFGTQNTWTAGQADVASALSYGSSIAINLAASNNFYVTLTGNANLSVPTNIIANQNGVINVIQDITGGRTLFGSPVWVYVGANGVFPTLSTAGAASDLLYYYVNYYSTGTGLTCTNPNATAVVVTWNPEPTALITGQQIQFSAITGSNLSTATTYWVTVVSSTTFKLSTSLANCQASTFINGNNGTAGSAMSVTVCAITIGTSSLQNSTTNTVLTGGTGATTFTADGVLYGNGTSAIGVTAAGTTGQTFVGTTSGAPVWAGTNTTTSVSVQNPTGTTSSTAVMCGLAKTLQVKQAGVVLVTICGTVDNNNPAGSGTLQIAYGTGSAPSNGVAATGTAVGTLLTCPPINAYDNFSSTVLITGLTVGTTYWFDLQQAAITAGTVTAASVNTIIVEIK
jgi:hypothetical protein